MDYSKGIAVLYVQHEEVYRFPVKCLKYVYAWTPRNDDEDLLKVVVELNERSLEYFCDELEFV